MEALHGTIDDSVDEEIVKPDITTTDSYSSAVASAQDDSDSGDDESTSHWYKEGFVKDLSETQA